MENSEYCFLVGSDDGTKVFVNGRLIINNDFVHSMEYQKGCTKLKKGLHAIEVQYFQGPGGGIGLVLRYKKMEDSLYQVFDLSKFFPITVNNNDSTIDISIGDEVLFEFNSYRLSDVSRQALGEIKRIIIDKTQVKSIIIKGYTDDIGSAAYNMKLSQEWANAVKTYLTSLGVPVASMVVKGFGETHPKTPNVDDANRRQNRRVEISVVKLN